jgi:type VI secretion system secreted protein VgrG
MTRYLLLAASAAFVALLFNPSLAWAQTAGAASSFAIVGGTAVSANGTGSVVNGDVGVSPGTAITGFPGSATTTPPYSTHSNDGAAISAQASTLVLYNFLAAAGPATPIPAQLNSQNLTPGIYSVGAADLASGGTLTLNGAGVYIFKVASSLVANVGSQVVLLGGASACNVYWQVTSAATLNGVNFAGNVVAQAAVTLGVGDQLAGRALTTSLGAVTLSGTNTAGGCSSAAAAPGTPGTPTPTIPTPRPNVCVATAPDLFPVKSHTGSFVVGTNATYSIAVFNNGITSSGVTTLTDTLPAGLTFVSAAGASWTCAANGQVVTCTSAASIPEPLTLTVTPLAAAVPSVTNVAIVAGGGDCDLTNNAASDVTLVSNPTAVPTLPEWAFIMLALLLGGAGVVALRTGIST